MATLKTEPQIGDTITMKLVIKQGAAVVNVSSATTKQILVKSPNGVMTAKTAGYQTDGTDGIIKYSFTASDFDMSGWWQLQGYVVTSGFSLHTEIHRMYVKANLVTS